MKEYRFRYGDGEVVIPLDEGQVLGELHGNHVPAAASIPDTLRAALENPIGLPPLRQWTKPGERVALVISDMSRFWMRQDKVIPPLVDYLRDECGIPEDHVTIIVANGTHDGGDEKELRTLVTDGVYDRVRVVNHDCLAKDLVYLGTTAHDTPVWINAEAAHAESHSVLYQVGSLGGSNDVCHIVPPCDIWFRRRLLSAAACAVCLPLRRSPARRA